MSKVRSESRPRSRHAAPSPNESSGHLPVSRLPRPVGAGSTPRKDALTAILSATALLTLLAGIPAALVIFVGNPLPAQIPDRSWLTAPVSATFLVDLLAVVLWAAWAHFCICVAAELRAARQHRLPNHVPCGGGSQLLARRLVAGLLVLSGTFGLGQPLPEAEARSSELSTVLLIHPEEKPTAQTTAATAVENADDATPDRAQETQTTLWYEVAPPEGRRHDCLWDIAERTLGDPRRHKEIFSLNRDRVQADGRRLVDADLIRPGWLLLMPPDARGPGITAVSPVRVPGTPEHQYRSADRPTSQGTQPDTSQSPDAASRTSDAGGKHATTALPQNPPAQKANPPSHTAFHLAPGTDLRNPDGSLLGLSGSETWQKSVFTNTTPSDDTTSARPFPETHSDRPHRALPQHPAEPPATNSSEEERPAAVPTHPTAPAEHTSRHTEEFTEPGVIARRPSTDYAVIGGGLLLAGVLVALATRRGPYADPDEGETPLRLAADPELSGLIDRGLRRLAAGRSEQQLPLPEITAAVAGEGELVLHLPPTPGATPGIPPAPWTAAEDGSTWTVREEDLPQDRDDVAAPYPALVNILSLRGFEVLVDLEAAPGLVSVGGNPDMARQVATSLAAELATNQWSDGIGVIMVGFGDELVGLAPASLRHANRLSEVLGDVDERLDRHAALLASLGVEGVLAGRTVPGARRWPPQILVLSGPPTPHESVRLHALLSRGRTPLGAVCVGDSPGARWRIVVDEHGTAELAALGLKGPARRLPQEEYRVVLELFQDADLVRQEQSERAAVLTPAGALVERAAGENPAESSERIFAGSPAPGTDLEDGQILLCSGDGLEPGPLTTLPGTSRLGSGEVQSALIPGTEMPREAPRGGSERRPMGSSPRTGQTPADTDDGQTPEIDLSAPVTVHLRLLGPVGIDAEAARTAAPADRELRLLTELVVAVSLHPDGIADQNLRSALWPKGASEAEQRAMISRAREWLGQDDTGWDRLHLDDRGHWRLTRDVRSDWETFRAMCSVGRGEMETDALRAALDLGHGEVFVPPSPGGYSWLAFARAARDARLLITTVARRAACLERARDRTLQARRVLEQGLVMVPLAEPLWRELIRLSVSDGPQAVAAIADRMNSVLASRGVDRPEPRTQELLMRLAPGHVHRTA
jgi:hypothetical protein